MDPAGDVIGGGIDGVELHGNGAGIDDIVLGAGGHEKSGAVLDGVFLAVDHRLAEAGLEAEELVDVVDFGADLFAGQERHQDELAMGRRVEDPAEIRVLQGELLDVGAVWF